VRAAAGAPHTLTKASAACGSGVCAASSCDIWAVWRLRPSWPAEVAIPRVRRCHLLLRRRSASMCRAYGHRRLARNGRGGQGIRRLPKAIGCLSTTHDGGGGVARTATELAGRCAIALWLRLLTARAGSVVVDRLLAGHEKRAAATRSGRSSPYRARGTRP